MKSFKRTLSALLCSAMILGLAACGGGSKPAASTPSAPTASGAITDV